MKLSMRTQKLHGKEEVIVSIEGYLDFETNDDLKKQLRRLEEHAGDSKIIFDLGDLQFVGSSGISTFIQTLREFNSKVTCKPGYANVRPEFRRMISAFDDDGSFDFLELGFRNQTYKFDN